MSEAIDAAPSIIKSAPAINSAPSINSAPAVAASPYELVHLSPVIGTEVLGIDLSQPQGVATIQWLSELLVERKVLFFRDQDISCQQHIDFSRRFGELEVHPFTKNNAQHPELIDLRNDRARPPSINYWHSDVTWRQSPSLGSLLRAKVVPEVGGDTLFANMESAYAALDEPTKAQIADLLAVHDNQLFLDSMRERGADDEAIEGMRREYPPVVHPVVRTHPVSGNKSLYVNTTFTRYIEGMEPAASEKLLEKLYLQAWIPDFQCRFRWRKNSIAFWDNRATQHYAAADYWPQTRHMERVTVVGEAPY